MSEWLINHGWRMYYSCKCNGTLKEYYNNPKYPEFEIRVRPKRQTFTILNKNIVIAGPDYGYNLEKKLKENGIAD